MHAAVIIPPPTRGYLPMAEESLHLGDGRGGDFEEVGASQDPGGPADRRPESRECGVVSV